MLTVAITGFCLLAVQLLGDEKQSNLKSGKLLFAQSCTLCHGQSGRGDGVLAAAFKPANLLSDSTQQKSDSLLVQTIKNGRAPMPAFAHQYNDDQIYKLVRHLRDLVRQ